tara:strand:+ start:117 stop:428 length:312 start_codon:yes stop_codon:yes gene_type:complete
MTGLIFWTLFIALFSFIFVYFVYQYTTIAFCSWLIRIKAEKKYGGVVNKKIKEKKYWRTYLFLKIFTSFWFIVEGYKCVHRIKTGKNVIVTLDTRGKYPKIKV